MNRESSALQSTTFRPGVSAEEVRSFVLQALSESGASRGEIGAALGSTSAAIDASDRHARIEVTLLVRGEGIDVRVSRRPPKERQPSFAEWLTKAIKRAEMSQETAAREIGVSLKTVNRWARGETEPRYRELGLIWDAFGERPPLPMKRPSARRRQDSNL